ncbi:Ent-kaurene synthase B, chloroplast precursor, putative [Ricinus communis]|uniref:Ent-trachylobane synthase KSL2, chloroplastic n=1 Tax=Ricinus communis TaxID=3988 RepID=KSL2_RICCO|nr:Ent-kaurene synthase B, chloroplast precursor, putative [Ricinus communis]
MLLTCTNSLKISSQAKEWESKTLTGMSLEQLNKRIRIPASDIEGTMTSRVKEMLSKVELSVSSYDTAWVAMVPTLDSSKQPLFPKSLKWIMENQQPDGSWGLDLSHPLLIKDSLSSTLACVLALQKWNVGQQLVHKGLDFVQSNIWAATDEHQRSPIGFDMIFPSMIEYGRDMGLNLSLNQSLVEAMLLKRDLETKRLFYYLKDKPSNLAYVAEGLNTLNDWKEVMKFQRSNGSLFNSPSSTAAALIHLHDGKCFEYLNSLTKKFGNAVPTIYPFDIYARLFVIDSLEKLGIDRYVREDKEKMLDDIYRCWMQGSEEIFSDPTCCAMAFRILRTNGYAISSDALANFDEKESLFYEKDAKSTLELFKASQTTIFQDEPVLDKINAWTSTYLEKELRDGTIPDKSLHAEVDYALKHIQANLVRLEHRSYIENYNVDNVSLLKASYRFCNVDNRDLLTFSFQDYNMCQSMHRKELDYLEGWIKKCGIDQLEYARQTIKYAAFSIASSIFQPKFSDGRISWAQNSVLTTIVDDFFDYGGSMEELVNLIELVQRWDDHTTIGYKSKEVEILFNAVYSTTNDLADKARILQGRCVKKHMIDSWIFLLKAMLKEAEWARNKIVPTMDDFIPNGYISFALGPIILTSLYLVEPLSEEAVNSEEYEKLYMVISILGRLINDRVATQSDGAQGKLNIVTLEVINGKGAITEEEVQEKVARTIDSNRRELLRMVSQTEGSIVPKACKDFFWTMSNVLHLFYMGDDGYSSPTKMMSAVNAVINEPIVLP